MNIVEFSAAPKVVTPFPSFKRRMSQSVAVLSLGLVVAGCGGGGGGDTATTAAAAPAATAPTTQTAAQLEVATIQAGVAVHDGVAGFLRMLNVAGVTRLTGQAGQVSVACPGGGSLLTDKLAVPVPTLVSSISTVFTMTANQCRFSSRDGLVYNGVWRVESSLSNITRLSDITFSPSGACAATCDGGRITVRTDDAKYGYGVADNLAPQVAYDVLAANNAYRFTGFLSGSNLTTDSPRVAVFSGNQSNTLPLQGAGLAFDLSAQVVDPVSGPAGTLVAVSGTRDSLKITAPFKAALQVSDAGVTAVVDAYGTTPAHTSTIAWSTFLD